VPSPSLTIVLPAYNEGRRIGPALDELFAYLAGEAGAAGEGVEVLVVDDGSTDDTAAIVAARPEPALRLLRRPHLGKGAAVRAGMLATDTDYIVFTDADLATPPDQLPLLTGALATADLALGSRIQADGSDRRASQPRHRRALGRLFHRLSALWLTGDVPDTQCGFKGFRHAAALDLFGRARIDGIAFDAEIIFLARRRGYAMAIVPVAWSDKRGSRMRLRPGLALGVLFDLLRIRLIHRRVPALNQEIRSV
jgi:dolichyl-phosphate beta-glucosyltransferase